MNNKNIIKVQMISPNFTKIKNKIKSNLINYWIKYRVETQMKDRFR